MFLKTTTPRFLTSQHHPVTSFIFIVLIGRPLVAENTQCTLTAFLNIHKGSSGKTKASYIPHEPMHEHCRCAFRLSKVNFIIILVIIHDCIYSLTKYNIFLVFKSCKKKKKNIL